MQRRKHDAHEHTTVGFKASAKLAGYIHEAADKARMSASRYLKSVVIPRVARDLGLEQSVIDEEPQAELRATVKEAAAAAGMSPQAFMLQAAAAVASHQLGRAVAGGTQMAPPARAAVTRRKRK